MTTLAEFLTNAYTTATANAHFTTTSMVVNSVTITVHRDGPNISLPFFEGGPKPKRSIQVSAKRSAVLTINASPYNILNSLATMDGKQWRVAEVVDGDSIVRFQLEEVDS